MTPDPTPAAGGPIDRLAGNRKALAVLLFAAAALWAVPLVTSGVWFSKAVQAAKKADPDQPKDTDPAAARLSDAADPNTGNYLVTIILSLSGVLTGAATGVYFLASLPPLDPARSRLHVRSAVLLVGGLFGLFLMLLGAWFFIDQYSVLSEWLAGTGRPKGAWKPVVAVLLVAAGAGLGFVAGLPARAEERNNQFLRRLVYGSGLVLTTLLLVMALVIGNVIAGVKLPNRLDTTSSGIFTLNASTEEFVRKLDRPVTVYALIPGGDEEPWVRDTRAMLTTLQDINPARFRVRFYGQTLSRSDLSDLKKRFPQADIEEVGLIVAVGEDESRYSFLRGTDLVKRDMDPRGRSSGKDAFQGEGKLVRELQFLADDKQKAAVYFTQGSGELSLDGGPDVRPDRAATQLKAYLVKFNVDVRPLPLDAPGAKVPEDAALVVILDPRNGLAPAALDAVREYMARPAKDGKKGKLIVAAGPHEGPVAGGGRAVRPSGLDELLGEYNVRPRDAFVYTFHRDGTLPAYLAVGAVTSAAMTAQNPIATALLNQDVLLPYVRPFDIPTTGGNPQYQTTMLLVADGTTWLEEREPANVRAVVQELNSSADARTRKQLSPRPNKIVAATAAEGTSTRLVAIGCGYLFTDEFSQRVRAEGVNPGGQFLALGIDFLRERPIVDVAVKDYSYYTPKADMGLVPLAVLPLGLAVLAVAGLGAGVWVVRRK